jgi:hypothetical protein
VRVEAGETVPFAVVENCRIFEGEEKLSWVR